MIVAYFMIFILLATSCVQYSARSIPVSQAINTGPVKVTTKDGRKLYYKNLFPSENGYVEFVYQDSLIIALDTSSIIKVQPKLKAEQNPVKISIKNTNDETFKGYLAYAGDSSIGYTTRIPKRKSKSKIYEINVREISTILYRKRSAPSTGFAIGTLAPFAVMIIMTTQKI